MFGRLAGTVSSSAPSGPRKTLRSASSGSQRSTGSSSRSLHQDHRCRGRDRFAQGGDAKDRVTPDWVAAAQRFCTDRIDSHLAAPADERYDAGNFTALDITCHDIVHAVEPLLRQTARAHYSTS